MSWALPDEVVAVLRSEAERVLPIVGAGLAIGAGVGDLVTDVILAARARGHDVRDDDDLLGVTSKLEAQVGEQATRQLVADVVNGLTITDTPALRTLAKCPGRKLATFNYDPSIEVSIRAVGLTPRPVLPSNIEAWRDPDDAEVRSLVHVGTSLVGLGQAPGCSRTAGAASSR